MSETQQLIVFIKQELKEEPVFPRKEHVEYLGLFNSVHEWRCDLAESQVSML